MHEHNCYEPKKQMWLFPICTLMPINGSCKLNILICIGDNGNNIVNMLVDSEGGKPIDFGRQYGLLSLELELVISSVEF